MANFIEVKATAKDPNAPEDSNERLEGQFNFSVGENIQEDVEMFGEDTVRDMWLRQAVVKAQAAVRREIENGTHPDDIPEALSDWRPDVQHTGKKDPKLEIRTKFKSLPAEEREALLAEIRAELAGEGA